MAAYYNENDPFAAAWLRKLITEGLIADGIVDERSITEVSPTDLRGFDQCHFFAGIGVWSHALRSAGWGDDREVWTGSCPCQPFSAAGKQAGFDDSRHLWPTWFDLIRQCRPAVVFGEQVATALTWFDLVSGDLENENYSVGAAIIGAHSIGAPHIRQRLYFVADSASRRRQQQPHGSEGLSRVLRTSASTEKQVQQFGADSSGARELGNNNNTGSQGRSQRRDSADQQSAGASGLVSGLAYNDGGISSNRGIQRSGRHLQQPEDSPTNFWSDAEWIPCSDGKIRPVEPGTFPLVNGTPNRVGRLRGYGNAIVAPLAAAFIEAYKDTVNENNS